MPRKGNLGRPKQVSAKKLQQIASRKGAVRSGSTVDVYRRAREYKSEGYSGELYYTQTRNMKAEENKLLEAGPGRHNVQKKSGAPSKQGTAYVIKGKKRGGKKKRAKK